MAKININNDIISKFNLKPVEDDSVLKGIAQSNSTLLHEGQIFSVGDQVFARPVIDRETGAPMTDSKGQPLISYFVPCEFFAEDGRSIGTRPVRVTTFRKRPREIGQFVKESELVQQLMDAPSAYEAWQLLASSDRKVKVSKMFAGTTKNWQKSRETGADVWDNAQFPVFDWA